MAVVYEGSVEGMTGVGELLSGLLDQWPGVRVSKEVAEESVWAMGVRVIFLGRWDEDLFRLGAVLSQQRLLEGNCNAGQRVVGYVHREVERHWWSARDLSVKFQG
ncbi:unnamed protein product [Tuber aestivum]|uniref:Uncharacterized protein n=1 Tax=Tuber aestivum TaxID=59557 RepID=A0A292PYH8_9PEZI|nr:unnamed protein product [Tuber aestivum]